MTPARATIEPALAPSLLAMTSLWVWLLLTPYWRGWLGAEGAILFSFGVAAVGLAATRPRHGRSAGAPAVAVGFLAGCAGFSGWIALIAWVGLTSGLPPGEASPPWAGGVALWIASVAVAPIFEELMYRERLLRALQARFGSVAAVIASSALFALPHFEAWAVLGSFLVGLALAGVYLLSGSVALAIAMHAGLNFSALVCGTPPTRWSPSPWESAALTWGLTWVAIALARRGRIGARVLVVEAAHG